ncbi:MAG: cation diffusion facilitator family transporter [Chloroflexota bacterium]
MSESNDLRGLKLTLGGYLIILAMKLGAYWMSDVMAMLAEALHTLSDIFVSGFLLIAAIYSRRQADQTHMFGYGRAQNVAALVAATLFISFTSFELYKEAIPRLFSTETVEYQNLPLAIGALVVSMVIAAWPLATLIRQNARGAAAKAQLLELVNDELGLIAALFGTLSIVWGWHLGDPLAAIVVATIIAYNAVGLFRENLSFLLGRSPGADYLNKMQEVARSVPGVLGVHDLRAEYIGPETIHAGMHIEVVHGTPIEEAERISDEVTRRIHAESEAGFCVIHIEARKNPVEIRE